MTKINQSYWQRINRGIAPLMEFPEIKPMSYSSLNENVDAINGLKVNISDTIGWYLKNREKFEVELDINRKCRALGIPAWLTGININTPELGNAINKFSKLKKYAMKQNSKVIKPCIVDINELCIYSKMYQEIEYAMKINKSPYPKGNPFENIMLLIQLNAIIIRFKYIKIGDLPAEEKLITYHLGKNRKLWINIEGDEYFIGWKYWGEGDEMIRTDYDIKIRWGIDDFNKNKRF